MDPSESAPEPPRGSLASWIVIWTVIVTIVGLIVLGGGPVDKVKIDPDSPFHFHLFVYDSGDWDYGWPLVFLVRERSRENDSILSTRLFSPASLCVDVVAGVLVALAGSWLIRWWRSSRQHWLQFHLSEILALTALVAAITAGLCWNCRIHEEQFRIANQLKWRGWGSTWHLEQGGPWWLRRDVLDEEWWIPELLDDWLRQFDRVVEARAYPDELADAAAIRTLKAVYVENATAEQLQALADHPTLEGLCSGGMEAESMLPPRLPQLRFLHLSEVTLDPRSAERLPQLEVLNLWGPDQDRSIEALVRMKTLQHLWLPASVSADGLERLRRELPQCEIHVAE